MKWDLTEHREIENQAFRELLDLVTDEVMPKTSLAELMNSDTPGFPAIADELGARWRLMNPKNPYKYISTQNRAIIEIKDFSEWVREAASIDTEPPDVGDMVFAEVGTFTNFSSSDAGVRTEMSANLEETFKDFLIRLWLRGVDLDWGVIFPDGTFQKVALPGYKFDRKSFWLTRIEGYEGPRVVRIYPSGSGLERIHSETPAGKSVHPETKETAGKARPDNMYSQDAVPGNRSEAGDQRIEALPSYTEDGNKADGAETVRSCAEDEPGNGKTAILKQRISADMSVLSEKTEAFLKQVIAQVIQSSPDKLDSDVNLRDYGIDSIMIHHFNAAMEKYFESLSKTLLFECRTIHEAADYMITYYEPELSDLLQVSPGTEAAASLKPAVHTGTAETRRKSLKPAVSQDEKPSRTREDEEIAVIGVSGCYPGAKNLDEFWENLKSGKDCITEIPGDRWNLDDYYDPDPEKAAQGKMYCKWGGFLKDADKFDPLFFNISPREAELTDPQERLFLETAWMSMEDAGYTRKRIRETIRKQNTADVGVFIGVTANTYLLLGPDEWRKGNAVIPTSFSWSIANRVSYIFDFQGPSIPVDTGCASSLTAVHLACESLKKGECSMAVAGGVNLYLHPSRYVWLCQMAMLSPSGKCHSFGINGDGFVPGEGVGAIVLKPLTAAIRDGDNIYAVIKGSSVNHGGMTYSYMVPNPNAQANLILQSLKSAGIDPRTVSYLEAQGVGSPLGDPIEITGLTKAYREYTPDKQYCPIGSAKSLIGHLEAAAGIAGLTKVLLQMKHRQFAPSLHCEELNPNIAFEDSPFYVQRDLSEWKRPVIVENGKEKTYPRRAGISAFGAGGANAHLILEEYQQPERETNAEPQLIVLSAKNKDRLRVYARNLSEFVKANSEYPLSDIAYTLQVGREAMKERVAVIADTGTALCRKLDQYVENPDACRDEDQIFTDDNDALKNSIFKDFTSGGFGKDFVSLIARHRDLHKAALLWVRGTDIPWDKIHEGKDVLSVSLPTYPFERKRYWISSHADIQSRESVLPSFPPPPREGPGVKIHAPHPPHPDPVHGRVQDVLRNMAAALLKMPENDIDFNQNLREYGFDSLAGMKLIHRIEDQYEIKISPAVLFEHNSISALAVYLSEQENMKAVFGEEDHTEEVPAQSELEDVDVDSLSDAEVDELLNRLSEE